MMNCIPYKKELEAHELMFLSTTTDMKAMHLDGNI